MLNFRKNIIDRARSNPKRLVLPEGRDVRVLKAAEMIKKEGFTTELYVLGNEDELTKMAKAENINLKGVNIIDQTKVSYLQDFISTMYEMRKAKGMTEKEAEELMKDDVYHGAMMLKKGMVDAMVSGSLTPTAKTVRASLIIVRPRDGIKTISGSFVMVVPDCKYGYEGAFIYADCGVVPEPTPEQLCDIAMASADSARKLLGVEPVVAFLSFSTLGSADSPSIDKVRQAIEILKTRNVDFIFDGEMQFDAAVDATVAKSKAPNSKVAGRANVMIFPDLNAGNIGYKITQRLAKAEAYGPLLQGLSKPVNDLSRGATPDDIMVVSAITVAQSN
ncbi:MAG: phosphate acetyltransferase [Brevinematia bacterium]